MIVAFDECGYTGQNLGDAEQPVFALASVHLSDEEALRVLSVFDGCIQGEFKYTKIKKAKRNRERILEALNDSAINKNACKIYPIHKPFMIVSKIVDNIYEMVAREEGIDLYEGRAALATANVIATTFPSFLGWTRFYRWLDRFSELCRRRDVESFSRFQRESEGIYVTLKGKSLNAGAILSPVLLACGRGVDYVVDCFAERDHDPVIPAVYMLVDAWSKESAGRFHMISDESKVIEAERARLLKFSDPNLKPVELQHYGFSQVYPLKLASLTIGESHNSKLIQVADLLSGATCHALNSRASGKPTDEMEDKLAGLLFEKMLIIGGMWPDRAVTPEALEADGMYHGNPVDYMMRIFSEDPTVMR
jgi:hypothetical protein